GRRAQVRHAGARWRGVCRACRACAVPQVMEWGLAYLVIGALVGFLAGLLGIGGGAVLVPMLVWAFEAQGMPVHHRLHVALGTAMATIFFTSLSSMRAHHRHGAVDWSIVRNMAPGILAGSFGAAL